MEGYGKPKSTGQHDALGMSQRRVLLVTVVIALLIIGSLFCVVFDREYWPFSQYPMFSEVKRDYSYSGQRLYGVAQEAPHHEVPLLASSYDESYAYMEPFDQIRLSTALGRIKSTRDPERRQKLLEEALLDCLKRYEELRLAGHHDGPPLQGMRLYKSSWQLDARAANVDQPDSRELIAEVEQRSDD